MGIDAPSKPHVEGSTFPAEHLQVDHTPAPVLLVPPEQTLYTEHSNLTKTNLLEASLKQRKAKTVQNASPATGRSNSDSKLDWSGTRSPPLDVDQRQVTNSVPNLLRDASASLPHVNVGTPR